MQENIIIDLNIKNLSKERKNFLFKILNEQTASNIEYLKFLIKTIPGTDENTKILGKSLKDYYKEQEDLKKYFSRIFLRDKNYSFLYKTKDMDLISLRTNETFHLSKLEHQFLIYLSFNEISTLDNLSEYLYNIKDKYTARCIAVMKCRLVQKTKIKINHIYKVGYSLASKIKLI